MAPDPNQYMRTSMTQESWDEFARALEEYIEEMNDVAGPGLAVQSRLFAVLEKYQDDLPMTTAQRTECRDWRRKWK